MRALFSCVFQVAALALALVAPLSSVRAQSAPASTAVPQGGQVSAGTATLQQTGTPTNPLLLVTQSSDRAVINWQSFNLGRDAQIQFQQPNAGSVTLNRVISSDPSQIFGRISSNGQIYLINPNGVLFSPSARVDVGGLVATTHALSDHDFMAGRTTFTSNNATGKVINEGKLQAHLGGYIALLAPEVRNAGVILAKSGTIALASGEAVTLTLDAQNSLTNLLVKPSTWQALVDNQKLIKATDGQVLLSAQAYNEITAGVIKNSGEISAKGISKKGGAIVLNASTEIKQSGTLTASSKKGNGGSITLDAKTVTQSGMINADSTALTGKGGRIMLTGDLLALKAGSTITANGPQGGGTVLIGGDWQGSNGVRQAETVVMEKGATISANATQSGDGGKVVLWSDVSNKNSFTRVAGSITANGGFEGGNGGQIETSGHKLDVAGVSISTHAPAGKTGNWLLDPSDVYIANSFTTTNETLAAGTYTGSTNISYIKASDLNAALSSSNVTVTTTSAGTATGNIFVYDGVAWSANTLTLSAAASIYINQPMNGTGTASLYLKYGQATAIPAPSAYEYYVNAEVNLPAGPNFTTQYGTSGNVNNYTVITSLGRQSDINNLQSTMTLQGIDYSLATLSNHYALGANIDATCTGSAAGACAGLFGTTTFRGGTYTGFVPLGTYVNGTVVSAGKGFSGRFDGLGHAISNLKIDASTSAANTYVGMFGYVSNAGTIRNLALLNAYISSRIDTATSGINPGYTGMLIAEFSSTSDNTNIRNIYTSGTVKSYRVAGGIIGDLDTTTNFFTNVNTIANAGLYDSMSTATIYTYGSTFGQGGGLSGNVNAGIVQNSISLATVINTVNTSADNVKYNGVLLGNSRGGYTATGNYYDSTLNTSYGTLLAIGTSATAGIVGTGLTTAQLSTMSNFPALNFSNTWAMGPSNPILQFMATKLPTPLSGVVDIIPSTVSMTYGSAPPTSANLQYLGFVNGDTSSVLTSLPTLTTSVTNTSPVGSYAFSISGGSSTNYALSYATGTITVTKAPLTVLNSTVVDKVYTANSVATLSGGTLSGILNNDTVTLATQTGTFAQSIVGSNITVTVADTLGGANAGNYYIVQPTGLTGNITPKPLTVSGGTATSKTYDGTTTATLSSAGSLLATDAVGTITVDGKPFTGDTVSLVLSSATFTQANVGSNITVNRSYTLTGASAGNYSIGTVAGLTANITAKALTVTGTTIPSKIYNKTAAAATPIIGTVTGFINNETLNISGTASALSNNIVGSYTSNVTYILGNGTNGGLGSNYTLANTNFISTSITAKPLLITGLSAPASKTYDGTTTITVSGTKALLASEAAGAGTTSDGAPYTGDTVSLLGTATLAFSNADVGTNKSLTISGLTLSGASASNYSINTTAQVTSNITPKALTITGASATGKPYDGTTTATVAGNLLAAEAAGTGTVSDGKSYTRDSISLIATGNFSSANAGNNLTVSGAFSLSGTGASNYTITQPTGLTATISKLPLTITASNLTKNYDGTAFSGGAGVSFSGFIAGESSSVLGGALTYTGTAQGASDAGTYAITPSGYTSTNYEITNTSGSLIINKVDAVVVTNSDIYTYNGLARTASGFSAYGLVNGQSSAVLSGVTLSGGGTNAGSYTVSARGTDRNYNLSFVDGTMTINKAQASITANSSSLTYDGIAHSASGFSATGLVNGQTASSLSGVSVSGGGTQAGTYPITVSGSDPNYDLTFTQGLMTINKAPLVIAAAADSKTYNGAAYTGGNGVTYTGFVNQETNSVLTGALVYSGSSQGAVQAGTYAITPSGLTASNYAISYSDGSLTINKAPLTVTALNASKTYDGQIYSGGNGVSYSGFVNGETATSLNGTLAYSGSAQAAVNAGTYSILPTGLTAANYDINFASGTLSVNKANATVTANSDAYVYNGQARQASGFTATGLVNGETATVLAGVTLSGGGTNAGTYVTSASGTDPNYNLSFVNGSMSIAKAPLTIRANNDAKFITQSDVVGYSGASYTGFVNGETAQVLTTQPSITRSNAGVDALGTYHGVLQASGAASSNYDISYVAGQYTIVPAGQLLVRTAPATQIYGGNASYTIASAQYLDANNSLIADLTSRTSVTGGNAVALTDGFGGSASFTIAPASPNYSTSGLLQAGGYRVGVSSITTSSTHFSNLMTVVGSLQVDQAPLTARVASTSKTYDGTVSAGSVALTISGTLGSDTVTGTGLGQFDTKNAGTNKAMSASSLALAGADATNYYLLTATATGNSGTIDRKAATVSGITAQDKIYDGTKQAGLDTSSTRIAGLLVGDTVTVSATGLFDDKIVGSNKTVRLNSVYSGSDYTNYSFTDQATATASITPQTLILSGITAANKIYDGTVTATLDGSLATASGQIAGDLVSISATGTFDTRHAGTSKTVTFTPTLSGADAANYTIGVGQTTTTASITPATLTVAGSTTLSKTYDGTTALPAGATATSAPVGLIGSDSVSLSGAPVFSSANAGQVSVTAGTLALTGTDASNYSLQWINGTGTITKASATVTGTSSTRVYDGMFHLATGFSATGLVNGESVAVLTDVTAVGSGKNAGTYAVTPSGTAANYALTFVDGTLTITKAPLAVTAQSDSKTYSGLAYAGGNGVSYSGFVATETSADLAGSLVYSGNAQGALNAGTYTIMPSGLLSNNYAITYYPADLTIHKAPLQVIANADAKFITQLDTPGYAGVSYSGFVNGETASVLTTQPTVTRSNTGTESPGLYSNVLEAAGGSAQNYDLSYSTGHYTIVPAGQLLVRLTNATQIYGGTPTYAIASAQYLDLNGNGIIDLQSTATVTGTAVAITDGVGGAANFTIGPATPTVSTSGKLTKGHYTIDATGINNTSVNFSNTLTVLGSLDVSAAPLTGAATAVTKTYDGSIAAGSVPLALTGIVAGDIISVAGTGTYADKTVGTGKIVNVSGLTFSGQDADNYYMSTQSVADPVGVITPKNLVVSGLTANTKTYDRSATAQITTAGAQLNGLIPGDDVQVSATGLFSSATAGTGKTVTLTSSYSGTDVANYTILDQPTTLSTILQKNVTLAGSTGITRAYDGTTAMATGVAGYGALTGVIGPDLVTVSGAPVFSAAATGTRTIEQGTLALAGADKDNYSLSFTEGSGTITKAPLTVRAQDASKTYDGLAYSGGNGVSYTGLVNGETSAVLDGIISYAGTSRGAIQAGTYSLTPSGLNSSNYAITYTNGTLTVAKALATVTAESPTYTYTGLARQASTFTVSGLVNGESASVLTGITVSGGGTQAGSYTTTAAGSSNNYDLSFVSGTLTINKAQATITASTDSYIYNGLTQTASGFSATGLVNGETSAVLTGISVSGGGKNVGTYTTTASGADQNYTFNFVPGTVTVTKAPLKVTAIDAVKTYDGLAYSGGNAVRYTGLVNGESNAVLGGTLTYGGTAQGAIGSGLYSLIPSGLTSGNYALSYTNGSLAVWKASAIVTANSDTYIYNGTHQSVSGFSVSGLVNGETASVLTGVSTTGGATQAGTYTASASGTDPNYSLSFIDGTLTIAKAPLTVTALNSSKTYDGLSYSGGEGVSFTGFVPGENRSVLAGTVSYSGTSQGAKNAGSYIITPAGLTSNNYDITYVDGGLNIAKAQATVTAKSYTYTYDGTQQNVSGFTTTGLVNGETNAVLTGVTASGSGKNAGTYSTIASGVDQNYTLSFIDGTLIIQPKTLTISGSTVSARAYDGTTLLSSQAGSLIGLINPEQLTVSSSATSGSKNAGIQTATLVYTLTDGANGGLASNYTLANTTTSVLISPKALTISGTSVLDKIYDGSRLINATAGMITGYVNNSETVTVSPQALANSKNVGSQTATVSYTLTDGLNGGLGSNYSLANDTFTVAITPKDLTVTGTRVSTKTFDGKTDATISGGTLMGVMGGDQITLIESGVFASSNAGPSVPILMNDRITGPDANNYRLLQPQGVTGTINANTPILYPSTTNSLTPQNSSPTPQSESAGRTSSAWSIEVNGTTARSTSDSQTNAPSTAANTQNPNAVVIKAATEGNAIQNNPDYLNVGRAIVLEAAGGNPLVISATVSFAKGFDAGRTILELNSNTQIKAQVNNETGQIILSGSASVKEYNDTIQTIRLKLNGSQNKRVISMTVGLTDQTGKRDTRLITIKPNDVIGQTSLPLNQITPLFMNPTAPVAQSRTTARREAGIILPHLAAAQIR